MITTKFYVCEAEFPDFYLEEVCKILENELKIKIHRTNEPRNENSNEMLWLVEWNPDFLKMDEDDFIDFFLNCLAEARTILYSITFPTSS